MSIGVGFLCTDGIVLCADTQITWPQNHKYYETKIYPHDGGEWQAVFTFAGNPDLMKHFNGKFRDTMRIVPGPYSTSKLQDALETVLSLLDLLDTDPDGLHMLCALAARGSDMRLLKTSRKVVSEVQGYDYVGVGDSSLLRFLGPMVTTNCPNYLTRQAFMLGTYFVMKAKTYIEGCGGDTDALILKPDGRIWPYSGQAYNAEQKILFAERYFRKVATAVYDKRVSDEDFAKMVDALAEDLKDEHFQIGVSIF